MKVDKYWKENGKEVDNWTCKKEDHEVLIKIIEEQNIESYFEIGTYTCFTVALISSHQNIKRLKGIDINYDNANPNIFKCDSKDYAIKYPIEQFDLVFIDGDHEEVKRDTKLALKMKPKVIAWHDYVNPGQFLNSVKKDVDLMINNNLFLNLNVEANIAWLKL